MPVRACSALATLAALATATLVHAGTTFDSRRIVFGRSVGDVHLGMTREQVEYIYGDPGKVEVLDSYFPGGTKYDGKPLVRMSYRIHGGALRVDYVDSRVKVINTTSSYYRTRGGTRVGSRIPLGPCHRNRYGSCEYRWHGFSWDGDCGKSWLRGNRRVQNVLVMRRGVLRVIVIGDPDVILYCF